MKPLLALAAVVAVLGFWLARPARVSSQSSGPLFDAQFRVWIGLTDTATRSWQGKVSVSGAELAGLKGWRFSQQDRAAGDGAFAFTTKLGPLENQLLTDHPYGTTDWGDPKTRRLIPQALIVQLRGAAEARVSIGDLFAFNTAEVPLGARVPALDGNAAIERLPVEQKLSDPGSADDYPALTLTPDGAAWTAWLGYRDQADEVMASDGRRTFRLSGRGDHHAPAIAADAQGRVHAVWPRREGEVFQLFEAVYTNGAWSAPAQLTHGRGSNLWPRLAANSSGRVGLVWQGFRNNESAALAMIWDGKKWSAEQRISEAGSNAWAPAPAFDGAQLWVAWDSYATGAYQIYARPLGGAIQRVTRGENFCVRPSIAVVRGAPVVAWEESDALWGKDFAYLTDRRGTVLYKNRRIRVARLEAADWKELDARVEDAVPVEIRRYVQQPVLATDGQRLTLALRIRTSANTARIDYWSSGGRWETFVTSLGAPGWTPVVPLPASAGRNSMRADLAVRNGVAQVAWATDDRAWPGGKYGDLDIFSASVPVDAAPGTIGTHVMQADRPSATNAHPNEREDTNRIRGYRYTLNGKTYRILRGDLHRHTELSGDGAGDGMLDDLYRYDLDAAAMDYAHVSDHQMGQNEEYNWWITQKSNDLYYMPQRFVPLYGYERSVPYPNGHRNIIWSERGQPVLKIAPAETRGEQNTGSILYPYLRETQGIATSHTSATEQGTDWRDNNPDLEPFVEIYQGYESNYEHAGAPRAWKPGQSMAHQGPRPAGYVWNAWAKGYKLGVQSSSDHVSTHSSYACILVEDFTRQGIIDAMRKRHTYAATDQIVMDFRIEGADDHTALMGDSVAMKKTPRLRARIIGTAPIKQVDIVRSNQYIHKAEPNHKEFTLDYRDDNAPAGESYYYVRAEQTDGQLVWSSPIWVTKTDPAGR